MNTRTYRTIIQKDGKYYHGFVPALPGCHTQGKTIEETQKNLKEAMEGYIQSLVKHDEPIPEELIFETSITVNIDNASPAYAKTTRYISP